MKHPLLLAFLAASFSLPSSAQLQINEIMQSNIDCVFDDINEFPDSWVELYNSGSTAVNISGYKLGITNDFSSAYTLPSQSISPHSYLLIYCDKEKSGLHTDFRLDSGKGGEVYLFNAAGQVVDKLTKLKKQPAPNISYGRLFEQSSEWGYQQTPTPLAANCQKLCTDILGEPVFSVTGRVVENSQPLSLTLSLPEGAPANAEIRYTLDGTEPTRQSQLYSSPISIASSRTLRAKLFCDGYLSPRSTTQSYIFFPRKLTLPVISIVTNEKYLTDSKIGIFVDGAYSTSKKNYEYDWRRPINIEYFESADVPSSLNQLCETRVQGGASRSAKFKSLALYANKRFGTKRFQYEFFPIDRPGVTDFKSVSLRNSGNDFDYLYFRDALIQRNMASHVDLDFQGYHPAIVYINGNYHCMLNIRERSNEDNIYTNYDGLEDIDMFENWWELKSGDWNNYNAFKDFYTEHGHSLAEYQQWMDTDEFINLMIMNLYYNNQDFPANNIVMWRPRTADGRWRWIAKDTDFGLGLYGSAPEYKTIEWIYNNSYDNDRAWGNTYDATRLFRRLMEDADFAREFIDRCAIYMGDFLNYNGTMAVMQPMLDAISYEYPYHRKLINQWWPNYNDEVGWVKYWLEKRTPAFYNQLSSYYHLGTPVPMLINNGVSDSMLSDVTISVNGVPLSSGVFDGKFFANRKVTLSGEAKPNGAYEVKGWTIIKVTSTGTTTQNIDGSEYTFTMPDCNRLIITAQFTPISSGIENVSDTSETGISHSKKTVYTLSGQRVSTLIPGQVYIQKENGRTYKFIKK